MEKKRIEMKENYKIISKSGIQILFQVSFDFHKNKFLIINLNLNDPVYLCSNHALNANLLVPKR